MLKVFRGSIEGGRGGGVVNFLCSVGGVLDSLQKDRNSSVNSVEKDSRSLGV